MPPANATRTISHVITRRGDQVGPGAGVRARSQAGKISRFIQTTILSAENLYGRIMGHMRVTWIVPPPVVDAHVSACVLAFKGEGITAWRLVFLGYGLSFGFVLADSIPLPLVILTLLSLSLSFFCSFYFLFIIIFYLFWVLT